MTKCAIARRPVAVARRFIPAAVVIPLAALSLGCPPPCPETYVPLQTLVAEHNANASRVPDLWARAKIAVRHKSGLTWGSTSPLATPNGLLLLGQGEDPDGPHDFVLVGRETAAAEVFRVGANVEQGIYYFWLHMGEQGQAWWGWNEYAGAPGIRSLPIDPHQLLAVLGVTPLPGDLTALPAVCVSMDRTRGECAYVLTYVARQPVTERVLFRREMYFRWADDEPRRLYKVNIFDNDGRRVMTARLDDYEPIDNPDAPPGASRPIMPTDIRIAWVPWPDRPAEVEAVHIVLSEMTVGRGDPAVASEFDPPAALPQVQVDAHLDRGGGQR